MPQLNKSLIADASVMRKPRPRVAVLKTKPETVLEDYGRLMRLARYQKALPKQYKTILKLNLSWTLYFPACSTQPWQLDGVVRAMRADGYRKDRLLPVENKTVVTNPVKGARLNKWMPILKEQGLKYTPLPDVKWVRYKPKHEMLALDKIFPDGHLIPKMFVGTNVVHFPTMKTHGHTTTTGAIKNAFGGLITVRRHHCHKMIHEVLVDLLQIQHDIHKGVFAVMDGTVAGDGNGPRTMFPHSANCILASEDQVAIDALAAKMMGFDPMKIPYLRMSHDRGLGTADVKQIEIVGDAKAAKKTNLGFSVGRSPVIFWDQMLRKNFGFTERLLFHTPLFKMCVFGSEFYHDWLWYPAVGRGRIRAFNKTPWGQLFKEYKQ